MMEELIRVVSAELRRAAAEAPTEAETARAKAQIKAGILMGLESSSARAEYMARQLLLFNRLIDTKEIVDRVEAVTPEAIRELVAKLLTESKPSVTVVGAGRKSAAHARLAERLSQEKKTSRASKSVNSQRL
jgi:predicted Zn-dependent peptidase